MDNHTEGSVPESTDPIDPSSPQPLQGPAPPTPLVSDAAPLILLPVQPKLRPSVTAFCAVLFLLAMGTRTLTAWISDRASLLEAPEEFVEHVFGRNLDLEEYSEHRTEFEKLLDQLQGYEPGDSLDEAISAYADCESASDWVRLRRTMAILYAEADRLDEAEDVLSDLESDPSEANFCAAVRSAYMDCNPSTDLHTAPLDEITAMVHPAWARDKLICQLADGCGEQAIALSARQRLDARAQKLHDQTMPLTWCTLASCAGGALVILGWAIFGFPNCQLGSGLAVSPWSAQRGVAVLVRAALGGVVVSELTATIAGLWPGLVWTRGFASLFAIIPLLWLGSRYLLRPWHLSLGSCFGLATPAKRLLPLALFTIALAAIDQFGSIAISVTLDHFGIRSHWAESPQEDYLWMPWWQVALDFWDGVVWAPIFEEIGCRGFLFVTIRRRFRAFPAALITGLIFGAVHFYSLSGFLSVAWSGFIWSLAYDKSRSLIPGMISHSMSNIMAFGSMLLFYRV